MRNRSFALALIMSPLTIIILFAYVWNLVLAQGYYSHGILILAAISLCRDLTNTILSTIFVNTGYMPIYFYWPFKEVPVWLEMVEFSGTPLFPNAKPTYFHNGFGIVLNLKGYYYVFMAAGSFIDIKSNGMDVKISGQSRGILCTRLTNIFSVLYRVYVLKENVYETVRQK